MIAVIPNTEPILKMLEPIKLPSEIAFSFFKAAMIDAASSGTGSYGYHRNGDNAFWNA